MLRGVKPSVFDINPIRRLEAYNYLCSAPNRARVIQNSDVLFCATGNQALNILDFRQLKSGCFVFSVTSSDDEINLSYLNSEYNREEVAPNITKYSNFNNHFYLVNKGNAVNFIHKAVLGDFIHLVRGEMIYALGLLLSKRPQAGLHELTLEERRIVAETWMNTFIDGDTSL
jgi:adenosylhomocysteinase